VRIANNIKGRKVLERLTGTMPGQFPPQRAATERLQNLNVKDVGNMERLPELQ